MKTSLVTALAVLTLAAPVAAKPREPIRETIPGTPKQVAAGLVRGLVDEGADVGTPSEYLVTGDKAVGFGRALLLGHDARDRIQFSLMPVGADSTLVTSRTYIVGKSGQTETTDMKKYGEHIHALIAGSAVPVAVPPALSVVSAPAESSVSAPDSTLHH